MHPELSGALARERRRDLLAAVTGPRVATATPPRRETARRRLGHALTTLGYAFVSLGKALASR